MKVRGIIKENHLRKDRFTKLVCHGSCNHCQNPKIKQKRKTLQKREFQSQIRFKTY